jgi:serpin B
MKHFISKFPKHAGCVGGNMSRNYFVALALICRLGFSSHAAPTDQQQLAAANDNFSFNLLQQLVAEQPGSNVFISPYSASTDLQMVSIGAAGSTKTEMQAALCTSNLTPTMLVEGNRNLGALINARNTNFVLSTANAIWYQTGFRLEPSFVSIDRAFFRATVEALNFRQPSSVNVINAWASNATHGKITKIVNWPIPSDVRLLLNNAVYFLGNWDDPFNTNLTVNGTFNLNGGSGETVPLMKQNGSFGYAEGSDYQVVRLPYKGNKLAMYVFLPGVDSSVQELLSSMNGVWWQQSMRAGLLVRTGTIVLPKFNLNFSASLKPALQALGMQSAFSPGANFSKISKQQLWIGDVKQQAVVEVNEKGTEAAAVTTITVVTAVGIFGDNFQMVVDRPFLFFIEDEQAGTILFAGAVYAP